MAGLKYRQMDTAINAGTGSIKPSEISGCSLNNALSQNVPLIPINLCLEIKAPHKKNNKLEIKT